MVNFSFSSIKVSSFKHEGTGLDCVNSSSQVACFRESESSLSSFASGFKREDANDDESNSGAAWNQVLFTLHDLIAFLCVLGRAILVS